MGVLSVTIPQEIERILQTLREAGCAVYPVGGCVRDSLLGRPLCDWDLTTDASPDRVKSILSHDRILDTGLRHGTVTVLTPQGGVEITTFRRDGAYEDHRHPTAVFFTRSLREDLSRRDFTVNAMALDEQGNVIDFFGGQADLAAGVIRCVGDPETRFCEDGLRILRALRFASVLDFKLEADTGRAIHAGAHWLDGIAAERIQAEWVKLLCGPGAGRVLREFPDLVKKLFPEAVKSEGETEDADQASKRWQHTLRILDAVQPDPVIRLAVFFRDEKPATSSDNPGCQAPVAKSNDAWGRAGLARLRLSYETVRNVSELIDWQKFVWESKEKIKARRLLRALSPEQTMRLLEICRKDAETSASGEDRTSACAEMEALHAEAAALLAAGACFSLRDLAVDGNDLLALGIGRGPSIGIILQELLNNVAEGNLSNTRETLLAEVVRRRGEWIEKRGSKS